MAATRVKTKRGAKAPRSAFRSKSPSASTTVKASTKKTNKTKTAAKAKASTKAAKAKEKAKASTRSKKVAAKAPASVKADAPAARAPSEAKETNGHVTLGTITVPSGTLAIFDIGLVGYLPREALLPAIVKAIVPSDRPLDVVGMRMGFGRYKNSWDHVAIVLGDGEVAHSRKLGEAGVDFARLACMDLDALDHWVHEESLDGKADVVFWGRDEKLLAKALRAQRTPEGYGWLDLPVDEAERKQDLVANTKSENKWLLASDFRPHSHHYHALAAARASRHGAGTLELADTRLLLFFTSWGDGVFPIYLDVDGDNRPLRIRIQLATDAAFAAMAAVNP